MSIGLTSMSIGEGGWLGLMCVFLFRHVRRSLLVTKCCLGPMSHFRLDRLISIFYNFAAGGPWVDE